MIKKITLILSLLLLIANFNTSAQLDSSITYVKEIAQWKVVYDIEYTYFYKKHLTMANDTTPEYSDWYLYASWYDTDSERYHYDYDSIGTEHMSYKETWDNDRRYSYYIDTADNAILVAYTIYYGENPQYHLPTAEDTIEHEGITVISFENVITIEASENINTVKIYNVEGTLMQYFKPDVPKMKIITNTKGLLIIKVNYNDNKFAVKKVMVTRY